jgi:gas vesicle structural protein
MTVASQPQNRYLDRPSPSSLADVIDTILDKGLVIDIYVRVSLVGIELLTIDARIVIASVDTYLRFAEAVNRLDLTQNGAKGLPELIGDVTEGAAKRKTAGAIDAVVERFEEVFSRDEHKDRNDHGSVRRRAESFN